MSLNERKLNSDSAFASAENTRPKYRFKANHKGTNKSKDR